GLDRLAEVVKRQLGRDIDVSRAGAAGGLAGGALAFMGARLVSGIDEIISHTGLARRIETADWVITGEGSFDRQSLNGKVVSGIVRIASAAKVSVGVLAGSVGLTKQEYKNFGVADAIAAKKDDMSLEHAIANSEELLMQAAADFARKHINR
ncbi:MAG: glycerate kinase, partial [Planctomycetes bacterium]|nr:glycerate kinase [Planctomycetota bacterium]